MNDADIQYISDKTGKVSGVIVPIDLWREIESEKETAYLLKSNTMRERLKKSRERIESIPVEVVFEKLGV
ncbi:MAG: prevent-host-death protein [Nitrospirae bacterium]|nr:prevent-host-death protein [Nitrospirota bacterium]MBF0534801.1 prevent-host-death protein [Nitrospirota bacterium]MBF0616475.1 prevent-host-death protein [Nitrospirota bacterium]